jgi:hypothetical protein
MPQGQSWQWDPVTVTDQTGTRDVKIIGSCNGTAFYASYFKDDGYGNHIVPDGSVSGTGTTCDEQTVKAWAVANYPNRH